MSTIFSKVISRELPADIVYEDDLCLAFRDIKPQAPVHVLLIPKKEIASMNAVTGEDLSLLGYLMVKAPEVASKLGIAENGYRLVINNGRDAGQSVDHIHIHILGGRRMTWPPG